MTWKKSPQTESSRGDCDYQHVTHAVKLFLFKWRTSNIHLIFVIIIYFLLLLMPGICQGRWIPLIKFCCSGADRWASPQPDMLDEDHLHSGLSQTDCGCEGILSKQWCSSWEGFYQKGYPVTFLLLQGKSLLLIPRWLILNTIIII